MPVPFLDLGLQYKSLKKELDDGMQEVCATSQYVSGPFTQKFEQEFGKYCDVKHVVSVSTGTAALELLLRAYNVGPNDEVITVANSFFATAEAISLVGATPILVDARLDDALIDVEQIARAITAKTKVIMPVHLYGQCADMDAIMALVEGKNIIVIEDACQAHGAAYKGKKAGSLGHAAAFSFYPGKNLGAYGEAGAVTTNDEEIAKRVSILRDHGMAQKYHHTVIGRNDRMDGLQGAVLSVKLAHLDDWNSKRRKHAQMYRKKLEAIDAIQMPIEHPDRTHNYHLFVIRTKNRDEVQKQLLKKGIATGIHYPIPIHLQEAYADKGWKRGDFPVSEQLANEVLSVPMYPEMTEEQGEEVCCALKNCVSEKK